MKGRPILTWTLITAALLAIPVYLVVSTITAERADTSARTAAALNAILDRVAPDQPGGADIVRLAEQWKQLEAAWRTGRDSREHLETRLDLLTLGDWADPGLEASREALAFATPLVAELKAGSEAGWRRTPFEFANDHPVANYGVLIGEPTEVRSANRLAVAALRDAAARADWAEVEAIAAASLACAAHIGRRPTLFAATIGDAISAALCDELWLTHFERDVPPETSERLIAALKRSQRERLALPDLLEGERHLAISLLDFYYDSAGRELTWATDAARGPDSEAFSGLLEEPSGVGRVFNVRALLRPRRRVAERRINEVFDSLVAWASLPAVRRSQIPDLGAFSKADFATSPTLLAMPAIVRTRLYAQADLAATIIAIRLEQRRASAGAYPATLAEAVPPDEIIDPATGAPFEYRLVNDDPHGRPYVLRTTLHIPPLGPSLFDDPDETRPIIDQQNLVPWRRTIEGSRLLDLLPASSSP